MAVIHVSLAATYSDLRQHNRALEHYRHELKLREGNPKEVPRRMHTHTHTQVFYLVYR